MHSWKTVALQRRFGFPAQLWPRRLQFWDLLRCLRGNAAAALGFVWRSRPRDGAGAVKTSFCFLFPLSHSEDGTDFTIFARSMSSGIRNFFAKTYRPSCILFESCWLS